MHRKSSAVVQSMHKGHMKWSGRIVDDMCQYRDMIFLGVYCWDNVGHSSVFMWMAVGGLLSSMAEFAVRRYCAVVFELGQQELLMHRSYFCLCSSHRQ